METSSTFRFFMFIAVVFTGAKATVEPSHEEALRTFLMTDYDKQSLPDKFTNVSIRFTIRHFDIKEDTHALEIDCWVVMKWFDPRMKWETRAHDDIAKLGFSPKSLWKPDLSLYNNADVANVQHFGYVYLLAFPDGNVMWVPPAHFKASCVIDLTYWPHDTQICEVKFGSWIYSGHELDFNLMDDKPKIDLTYLDVDKRNLTRGSWKLLDVQLARKDKYYSCCEEPYIEVKLTMKVQRVAEAFHWTVQMPVILLCILTLLVFLMPPDLKEKITFIGILLIIDMFFVSYLHSIVEISPSHTPLIVKLVCLQLVLTTVSAIISTVVLRFSGSPHSTPLPFRFKQILGSVASVLFVSSYKSACNTSESSYATGSLKSDDSEHGGGSATTNLCIQEKRFQSVVSEWVLLAAVIERVALCVYVFIFIVNIFSFISVL